MDFEKICMIFTMQEPYYGILLSSMERVPDKSMQTLGVGRFGNVFKLYYNPDWVGQFNTDTVLELIRHELLHIALNHFVVMEDKEDGTTERHKHCNAAIDLEANCYINRGHVQKEAGGLFVEDFGFKPSLGSREYYDLLEKLLQQQQQQKQQAKQPQQPCNGGLGGENGQDKSQQKQQQQQDGQSGSGSGQGQEEEEMDSQTQEPGEEGQGSDGQTGMQGASGQGNTPVPPQQPNPSDGIDELIEKESHQSFDDHSRWPDCNTEQEQQALQQVIDDMLEFAADEVEKKCGNIPGELVGKIEKIRKKPRPVADWKRYFRRFCGNEYSDQIRKSKKRESRRYPDAAGNRHRRKSHILVAIDTSGSVSMPEYNEFFGQIKTLSEKATFHVVECDTRIQYEYDYKGRQNETLHGGGGTRFEPPIELFLANRRKYDALIYFTDGEAEIPSNTPKETLWVISSKGDHDRSRYKVNGATSVFITNKQ